MIGGAAMTPALTPTLSPIGAALLIMLSVLGLAATLWLIARVVRARLDRTLDGSDPHEQPAAFGDWVDEVGVWLQRACIAALCAFTVGLVAGYFWSLGA